MKVNDEDDGRPMVAWKTSYPEIRVALGMAGLSGYRGMDAARVAAAEFPHVRTTCGKVPSIASFKYRMAHGDRYRDELLWIQRNNPAAVREGQKLHALLTAKLVNCRVNFERIKSPHDSANASTEHNAGERGQIKAAEMQKAKVPKGASRRVSTGPRPKQREAHD